MADSPLDPAVAKIFDLTSLPGIRRDGTNFDGNNWSDGQWVRFQRGRPRKIGGYRLLSNSLYGPVRLTQADLRGGFVRVHTFSQWGIEQLQLTTGGAPAGLFNRTPTGFVPDPNLTWQADSMFQSGGGGTPTLVCSASPDLLEISSSVDGPVYSGDITGTAALTPVQDGSGDILVSGGVTVLQPFVVVYGNNGLLRNSNPNDISAGSGWTTGGANYANTANVAGTKIVQGIPMRGGGQSPSGLFWAMDALIRMSFVGGTTLWSYDTLSTDVTVLSKEGIVEYDNSYYWIGVDRFYVFNGVVQELPNDLNLNWFFDNLNYAWRQKVWATKVTRFGEIWWCFPSGESTECDAAIIYNVRERTWYDTRVARSAGSPARVYPRPIMAEPGPSTTALTYEATGGSFTTGEEIVGLTSGATATLVKVTDTTLNLTNVSGTFLDAEDIEDTTHGGIDTGTLTADPFTQDLASLWEHERGVNAVGLSSTMAIESYIESSNLTWLTGSPTVQQADGSNYQMRLLRLEPDFIMSGGMTLRVSGRSYAQSPPVVSEPYPFDATTEFIDLREQRREMTLRFTSNVVDGTFQIGKLLLTFDPGDERG